MAEASRLITLGEKALHQPADPALLTYCPSMDLIALTTADQQVLIYRLNGQRVYGSIQKSSKHRVAKVRWKPNGQLLSIAGNDGSIRLVGAESSKIVHQFSTSKTKNVTCLGWATNLTNRNFSSTRQKKAPESWTSFLVNANKDAILDLPRELSLIDIETSLPKLSVLAAGSSEDVFSSRTSLEAVFRAFDPKDNNSIDVMVVGTAEGRIHLSIYDSFVIGSFPSPEVGNGNSSQLCLHSSHERSSTHALLLRSTVGKQLYFVPMDLRFISASSEYLSLLASRSTTLQNLLRYINQVQIQMVNEWKATRELPGRFLSNINETLAEKDNCDIIQALCHSVATGHTFPSVREWLVDELSERGHKRWDKAVTTGLENLRRLVHENMLPALERCSLILSRFLGIAKFQGANSSLGFTNQQIILIMDTVACLHLVSSKILIQTVDELELFASFSLWLRFEIDRLASDSSTSLNDDVSDKEASIDHNKVLSYLQTAMMTSPLSIYLGDSAEEFADHGSGLGQGTMYEMLEKQLNKYEKGLPYMQQLPRVENLCQLLTNQASTVFGQIADAEKRNVLFGGTHELGSADSGAPIDMRLTVQDTSYCVIHATFVPLSSNNIVKIIRVELLVENGISSYRDVMSSSVQLGSGVIKDLKFWDDTKLLILWESDNVTSLLTVPYTPTGTLGQGSFVMTYHPHTLEPKSAAVSSVQFSSQEVTKQFVNLEVPEDASFKPIKLEIREGVPQINGPDSRRIIILSADALHYKVLAFPSPMCTDQDEDISMS